MTLPASALMTTQGTYTGQNIGANRLDRVKTGAKHTVLISEIITICILIVVFIFARPIVAAFGLGEEAIGYCAAHVRFVALCLPLFASYFPLLGLFLSLIHISSGSHESHYCQISLQLHFQVLFLRP